MDKELVLILGGARSGKSTFAEQLAMQSRSSVLYVATATAGDSEMAARIAAHKAARPASWRTLEAHLHVARQLQAGISPGDFILLDCMTLLASNILFSLREPVSEADFQAALSQEVSEIIQTFQASPARTLTVVSNEVGLGLVPEYELGRIYRDGLGRINQQIAQAAHTVWLMVAGLPIRIK